MSRRRLSAGVAGCKGGAGILLLLWAVLQPVQALGDPVYLIATLSGEQPGSYFGRSVSCADFNLDGYDDILVGAPQWRDPDSILKGRIYFYYGGVELDSVPDMILTGYAQDDSAGAYGASVAGLGDVNGDGREDIIAGDPWIEHNFNPFAGKAYVYCGGTPPDTVPEITFVEPQCWMGQLGGVCSGVGDVNGDAHDDVVVATIFDDLFDPRGQVFVYFGGPLLDSIADLTISGYPDDMLGQCMDWGSHIMEGSDLNADGFNDLTVGVPRTISTGRCGSVWIFFGGPSVDSIPDLVLNGQQEDDYFGQAVSCCDIDADGDNDLIVAAPNDSLHTIYIYLGEPGVDTLADLAIGDFQGMPLFITSGDMNGDGHSDLAVAAVYDYVFWGGLAFDTIPDIVITDNTGGNLAFGDVNTDGYSDLVVGDLYSDIVYVYSAVIPGVGEPPSEWRNSSSSPHIRSIPNPFSTSTTIHYSLQLAVGDQVTPVELSVYDVTGRLVETLVDKVQPPGAYRIEWDAKGQASGVYFYRLATSDCTATKKMVILK